jgi:hypothetical protein
VVLRCLGSHFPRVVMFGMIPHVGPLEVQAALFFEFLMSVCGLGLATHNEEALWS